MTVRGRARARGRAAPVLGPPALPALLCPNLGFVMKVFRDRLWQVTVPADCVLEDLRRPGLAVSDPFQRCLVTPVRLYISEKVTSFGNSFSVESWSHGTRPGSTQGAGQCPAVPALLLPAESLPAGSLGKTPVLPKANRENVLKKKLSKHACIRTGCLLKRCTTLIHIFLFSCHIYNLSSSPLSSGWFAWHHSSLWANCSKTQCFSCPCLQTSDPVGSGMSQCSAHPGVLPVSSSCFPCPSLMAITSRQ